MKRDRHRYIDSIRMFYDVIIVRSETREKKNRIMERESATSCQGAEKGC